MMAAFAAAAAAQGQESMTIKLYFLNEKLDPGLMDCNNVKPVERQIPKTNDPAKAALLEFFKGVNTDEASQGFFSFNPGSTADILKRINIRKGAAYVNFNDSVYEKLGAATTSCGGGFFTSIERTLQQFPAIEKVFYAIEGKPRDFYEWVQVGECPAELRNCSGKNFR